jgi:hypothetical protein
LAAAGLALPATAATSTAATPEKPPPPEPLLDPGAVEAEMIVLDREEPTLSVNPVALLQGLLDPEYQRNPWLPPLAAAAASTPAKRSGAKHKID